MGPIILFSTPVSQMAIRKGDVSGEVNKTKYTKLQYKCK